MAFYENVLIKVISFGCHHNPLRSVSRLPFHKITCPVLDRVNDGARTQSPSLKCVPRTNFMQGLAGFPNGSDGKESTGKCRRPGFDPSVRKIPWRRERLSTPVFLPGKSHGQRSLMDYSPWSHKELDMTE